MRFMKWPAIAGWVLLVSALAAGQARADTELLGPLRIRDMTPFNLLRLDMLPAHAGPAGPEGWAIEADLSYTNTYVMSDNVRAYLAERRERRPLTRADVDALSRRGEDFYFVDGEVGLLDLTVHRGLDEHTSLYLTLPVYSFSGGFLDGAIEGFHDSFGFGSEGRDLVARDRSQVVLSLGGLHTTLLEPPIHGGVGDPVLGVRYLLPLRGARWSLVLDAAAKVALGGDRTFLSTGTNDYGVQLSLQGKLRRQGIYLSGSYVLTDGRVLGVHLGSRAVPTLTAAYEVGLTRRTNLILQLYASESAIRDTAIEEIKANKYQASLGLRSRRGRLVYGFAITENIANFDNTPDVGVSLTLAWLSPRLSSRH
jgi:hypothetical protein